MTAPLFRPAALERLSTPEQLDQAIRVTSPSGWIGLLTVLVLIVAALIWGILGTVPIKVAGRGILLAPAGVLDVVSDSQGRVVELLVAPGDAVARDQVVATVAQPDLRQKRDTLKAEHAELTAQRDRIQSFHQRETRVRDAVVEQRKANAHQSVEFLQDRLRWLTEREGYESDLLRRGLIPRQRHIDTQIEINTVRESIARTANSVREADLELDQQDIARQREILSLDLRIEAAWREVQNLDDQIRRRSEVRSPYAGRVVEMKVNEGEIVNTGSTLFSLLPPDSGGLPTPQSLPGLSDDLIAILFVPPAEGKKVRPGMEVQIAPATVKREEYGFMQGVVGSVAEIPSTPAGMLRILKNNRLVDTLSTDGAPFQVTVRLRRNPATPSGFQWSSSRGPDIVIDSGTPCDGTVTVREMTLIGLAIPALEPLLKGGSDGRR